LADDGDRCETQTNPNGIKERTMKSEHLLEEIREANLSYLMLAQRMVREDRVQALYRLGLTEEIANVIERLTAGQILKIAASNMLICRFRFDDQMVWDLLTSHGKDRNVSGVHAAILMSSKLAEVV
jgi:flagellar transcriptional activator FlhD